MIVIAVIGSKKSGKTTTIEALVKGLTKRSYRVATVKHVSEQNFTVDTEGKDTWRHAKAGAQTVAVVAPQELAVIKKVDTVRLSLHEIIENLQNNMDIVIFEGFRNLVEQEPTIPKIVAVKSRREAVEASKRFKPILAFTGLAASTVRGVKTPVVDVLEEPEKLVEIVERKIRL